MAPMMDRKRSEMNRAFSADTFRVYGFSPRRAWYERRAFGAKQPLPSGAARSCYERCAFGAKQIRARSTRSTLVLIH